MKVLCRRKGIVTVEYCQTQCPDWKNASPDNIWGNSERTCEHFGEIVRSPAERQQLGAELLRPGTAAHERESKKLEENEERDVDHASKKKWHIAVSDYNTKLKRRKILE
jgi:hypothetical protein